MITAADRFGPILALAFSLLLHGLVFGLSPSFFLSEEAMNADFVVVELEEPAQPTALPTVPERSEPKKAKPAQEPVAKHSVSLSTPVPAPPNVEETAKEPTMAPLTLSAQKRPEREVNRDLPAPDDGVSKEATLQMDEVDFRYRSYLDNVWAAVEPLWRWRDALMAAKRPGLTLVGVSIEPDGGTANVRVVETSGSPVLDEMAVSAILAADIPPFPEHWTIERLNLFAEFDLRLE